MIAGQVVAAATGVNSESALWRGEGAVRALAPLSADHVVGSSAILLESSSFGSTLDNLCRFSFFRAAGSSSHKRRKIAFEEKSVIRAAAASSGIEVKFLGAEVFDVEEERPTLQQRIARVGEELIHVDCSRPCTDSRCGQRESSSPMLRRGKGDIVARPGSVPNMLHQEDIPGRSSALVHSGLEVRESKDNVVRWVAGRDGDAGAVVPCGSSPCALVQSNCVCEALGGYNQRDAPRSESSTSWDFKVAASVKVQNRNLVSTDVIGTIAFERTNEFFATGGIARKIRVYAYTSLASGTSSSDEVDDEDDEEEDSAAYYKERRLRKRRNSPTTDIDHARCCVREVCTPAKLSSLQWHQERPNLIACGDYDGVVAEWDIERNCAVSERDETGGQRIWSIDYSKDFPDLIASASDDGTVRMWDRGSDQSVAILTPPTYTSICCAEFGPASSSLIALASADSNVYLYDTRWLSAPLLTLSHHKRAASYVRFLSRHSLVSASIDSSVKLWDISVTSALGRTSSPAASAHYYTPMKTFDSHYNVRNFTGLSVRSEDGLIACGSETNQAFVYDSRKFSPILTHSFDYGVHHPTNPRLGSSWSSNTLVNADTVHHPEGDAVAANIVSAVCWRPKPDDCTLVAANSDGVLRVLQGTVKP